MRSAWLSNPLNMPADCKRHRKKPHDNLRKLNPIYLSNRYSHRSWVAERVLCEPRPSDIILQLFLCICLKALPLMQLGMGATWGSRGFLGLSNLTQEGAFLTTLLVAIGRILIGELKAEMEHLLQAGNNAKEAPIS